MLILIQLLMMMMKTSSAGIITVSAQSGDPVLLSADQPRGRTGQKWDVRWTHLHLVLSLRNNMTTCHHGRCELLSNGSLRFSRVQTEDSGNYSLQLFDQTGTRLMRKDFLLMVEETQQHEDVSLLTCFLLLLCLLLLFIILFILRRRRTKRTRVTGPTEENVYVSMHGRHGNKWKDEEEKHEREEESVYVPCVPAVSMETPMSVDAEDIYV